MSSEITCLDSFGHMRERGSSWSAEPNVLLLLGLLRAEQMGRKEAGLFLSLFTITLQSFPFRTRSVHCDYLFFKNLIELSQPDEIGVIPVLQKQKLRLREVK